MNGQFGMMAMTPVVKKLLIINISLWLFFVVIVQNFFLNQPLVFQWFGLVPWQTVTSFWLWQPFTYMFLHSNDIFHILFNMLMLWMLGSELETRWGSRFFLSYYLVCGVGAALIYCLVAVGYFYFVSANELLLTRSVVGASGAIFGLLLAYGILFGDRVIYFMMMFPMKARHFVILLGGIEVVTLLNSGFGGPVAVLAHLGGLISGYLFLVFWSRWQKRRRQKPPSHRGRKLKLVVDNSDTNNRSNQGPRYWN